MKIRDLKTRKDMMMVFDANADVRAKVWYLVSDNESQNINAFLEKFEGAFVYIGGFQTDSLEVEFKLGSRMSSVVEAIENLNDSDFLPPEFNLHKVLELANLYMCTDDAIKVDEILGDILDEFEEGFNRFMNRIKSRDYLLYSFEKFIDCGFEEFEDILDKEIDDAFYIIEEPQTPKMRKYLDASKEDRDKIWERNPKFREEVRKEVIAYKQDFLNDTTFSLIKGATTYINIEKNICLIEVYNDKMFVHSLLNILNTSALDFNSELETTFDKIRNEGYNPTNDDVAKLIGSLKMTVEIAHQSIQNMDEIREYHEDIILDTLEEDDLVYDDNFTLYKVFA